MRSIGARLERLETLKPARIILEMAVDGQARRMSAEEFVAGGFDFLQARIVSGNSLADARRLLDTFPAAGID